MKDIKQKSASRKSANVGGADRAAAPQEEFELKLDVDPSDVDALLALPPLNDADAKDRQQNSVYFDTPSRSLRDAGFSLRVRTIGERRVQTVKATGAAAAGLFVRPEWEHDVDSETPILSEGETPLRGLIPDAELKRIKPVFSVEVIRKTVMVDQGDALIEVVLDRGRIISDQHSSPVHELEFELKRGNPAALFRLAHDLDQTAPLRLGVLTKSDRGYMLRSADAGKPVKTAPLTLQPGTTVRHGFQAIVGACLRQFRLNEAILLSTGDPDALHQARVSLRRLRSALSTFKPIVQDERLDQIRGELRWIAAELGHARNLDVLLARIDDRKAAPSLEEAHDRAYHAVKEALHSARLRRLMLEITEWLAIGQWATSPAGAEVREQPLEIYAAKVLGKHRRRLKRLGRDLANVTDERRHETRIEAKKLRYGTEFFGSLFTADKAAKRLSAFHKRLASLQSYLGDLNDIAMAPLVLAELGLVGTPTEAALQPDLSRRKPLIAKAARAHEELMDAKRFW